MSIADEMSLFTYQSFSSTIVGMMASEASAEDVYFVFLALKWALASFMGSLKSEMLHIRVNDLSDLVKESVEGEKVAFAERCENYFI